MTLLTGERGADVVAVVHGSYHPSTQPAGRLAAVAAAERQTGSPGAATPRLLVLGWVG
ncbi:hypothetical protein ABZ137_22335 [Streptomyces bobili]|uniref:hypothetical protein n=1 Tax=Streptomyces bobili TaxID=67280 RepID=UPI00339FD670